MKLNEIENEYRRSIILSFTKGKIANKGSSRSWMELDGIGLATASNSMLGISLLQDLSELEFQN